MRRRTDRVGLGLLVLALGCGHGRGCDRSTAHYDRGQLAQTLEDPDSNAGLVLGEFSLAPDAVVDGDTIKVGGLDTSLRLLGLDTEETFKSRGDQGLYERLGFDAYLQAKGEGTERPVKCATPLGMDAKDFAKAFFKGDVTVRLERDHPKELRGRFGRLLAYVFVNHGDGWVNYNIEAVRAGMSPYFTKYGYSRRFHDAFVAAQDEARAAGRGIWDPAKEHYRDYDVRLSWWDGRADFIERFETDAHGRDDMIVLTHWDALDRIAAAQGDQIQILAGVGDITPSEGTRPARVSLSRRMFSDFPLIFFDDDVLRSSRIEESKGEFVRVIGTVSSYTFRKKRRGAKTREQLQIEIKRPDQVVVSDTAPSMGRGPEPQPQPQPQPQQEPEPEVAPEPEATPEPGVAAEPEPEPAASPEPGAQTPPPPPPPPDVEDPV